VFVPVDFKAMGPWIAKLNAAKIPAVNVADRAQTGDFVSFVGASDYQLGLQTARYLLKSLGGKGNVIILEGVRGTSTSEERMRGFHDALKEAPAVKVLSSQPGNYQRMLALQVTENLLQTMQWPLALSTHWTARIVKQRSSGLMPARKLLIWSSRANYSLAVTIPASNRDALV
jgi:ABC-type sugar transport system substrate-binding protein